MYNIAKWGGILLVVTAGVIADKMIKILVHQLYLRY